jgi:drug/metabolite transporter (DMT)-like permease
MSDRLLLPLAIPLTLGFIGGVIVSVLQLGHGATVWLGIVCGLVSLVAGAITAARADTTSQERNTTALLRSGLALGLFLFLYIATLSLLRDGKIVIAVIFLLLAGGYALLLSRMGMLNRRQLRGQGFAEFHKRRAGA